MTQTGPTVADVVAALDGLTGGRITSCDGGRNPWVISKDSGIPGKAVTERPGLVWGVSDRPVRRLAVAMTITEHHIELANASGVDAIVAHHPIADAASSGGVALADYLSLYGVAVLECHEAFHGLHPGMAYLHGHRPFYVNAAYDGVHGLVVMVGRPLPGVITVGDVLSRLNTGLERSLDMRILEGERAARQCADLVDSATAPGLRVLAGALDDPLGDVVLHAFPHTGFGEKHLAQLLAEHPTISTVIFSISAAAPDSAVVASAAARGLNVLVGTSHASEIFENGLPLAFGLSALLPDVDVVLFRDRVVSIPINSVGTGPLREYGRTMAHDHLLPLAEAARARAAATTVTATPLSYSEQES
ncbi:Nif3-like dinuclear metal center hexameric protein [Micromonospora sp. NPDC048930]|uniref:Nif3-like dinuclear metal center hexameric protein n=1 Tax=Micromonospora sp. NPDC048930 TaxID=3364261 RepID=UPI003718A28E